MWLQLKTVELNFFLFFSKRLVAKFRIELLLKREHGVLFFFGGGEVILTYIYPKIAVISLYSIEIEGVKQG